MTQSRRFDWQELLTVLRFGAVGVSATLLHGLVAYALLAGCNWSLLLANSAAFSTAVTWSYVGHAWWTFGQRQLHKFQFVSFIVAALIVFGVITGLALTVQAFELPDELGIAATVIVAPVASFLINRFVIFSRNVHG